MIRRTISSGSEPFDDQNPYDVLSVRYVHKARTSHTCANQCCEQAVIDAGASCVALYRYAENSNGQRLEYVYLHKLCAVSSYMMTDVHEELHAQMMKRDVL